MTYSFSLASSKDESRELQIHFKVRSVRTYFEALTLKHLVVCTTHCITLMVFILYYDVQIEQRGQTLIYHPLITPLDILIKVA